ncbi:MAG: hypothetical protein HY706_13620 [Candidatus Hydrogenedentes bacterium]|nr:hypothetical protein [Candidatus Hydrogenedentota bacterium]
MLLKIIALTLLSFGVFYPLFFWVLRDYTVKGGFYRVNLGLVCVVGSFGAGALWRLETGPATRGAALVWIFVLLAATAAYWHREKPNEWLLLAVVLLGLLALTRAIADLGSSGWDSLWAGTLGGLVLAGSVFATVLGHWYLNVWGMPMRYLMRAAYALWILVALRLAASTYQFATAKALYDGDPIPLTQLLMHADGVFLGIAVLFGALLPCVLLFFVKKTLDVRSNTSATGLLYVILCSIIIGELAYRFCNLQLNVVL